MDKRAIFPTLMFVLAGCSFAFGGWQYLQARSVAAASAKRMAYIVTTIEKSPVSRTQKQGLYASIMGGLPSSPGVFSLDFSGSFASQTGGDSCTSDGQRAVCGALKSDGTAADTYASICGACNPQ